MVPAGEGAGSIMPTRDASNSKHILPPYHYPSPPPEIDKPVVAMRVWAVVEMPKSAILATMCSSNNTFWGLRSRCTTACLRECKNRMPCAT